MPNYINPADMLKRQREEQNVAFYAAPDGAFIELNGTPVCKVLYGPPHCDVGATYEGFTYKCDRLAGHQGFHSKMGFNRWKNGRFCPVKWTKENGRITYFKDPDCPARNLCWAPVDRLEEAAII